MQGLSVLFGLAVIVGGIFISVLSVAALIKIIQIAEDLRYLRSKTDISVQRPKPAKNTLFLCLGVSIGILLLLICFAVGAGTSLSGFKPLG